jgi:hypothetical protein
MNFCYVMNGCNRADVEDFNYAHYSVIILEIPTNSWAAQAEVSATPPI